MYRQLGVPLVAGAGSTAVLAASMPAAVRLSLSALAALVLVHAVLIGLLVGAALMTRIARWRQGSSHGELLPADRPATRDHDSINGEVEADYDPLIAPAVVGRVQPPPPLSITDRRYEEN